MSPSRVPSRPGSRVAAHHRSRELAGSRVLCWRLGLGCLGFPHELPGWGARRAHVPVSPSGKPHPRDTAPERETLPGEGKQARRRGRRWPPQLCSQSGDFIHCPPVGVSSSLEHFGAAGCCCNCTRLKHTAEEEVTLRLINLTLTLTSSIR